MWYDHPSSLRNKTTKRVVGWRLVDGQNWKIEGGLGNIGVFIK